MIHGSPHRVKLPGNIYRDIDLVLRHKHIAKPDITFSSTQQHLLERLYQADFQVSAAHVNFELRIPRLVKKTRSESSVTSW